MNRKLLLLVGAAVVSALQIGVLSWTIAGRAAILRHGTEIRLKVEPVDPRDLLRGDYVRLGYEASTLPRELFVGTPEDDHEPPSNEVWVLMRRDADGIHRPVSYAWERASLPVPGEGEALLRGNIQFTSREGPTRADYGIGRFYLPEGTGKPIERDMLERPFFVVAAVSDHGTAQIKQFLDGDTVLFEEPPF